MQGSSVKSPEEFDKEAQVPRAVPADTLERKVHLLASLLKSSRQAFSKVVAMLTTEGRVSLAKDIDTLLALEGVDRRPAEVEAVAAGAECAEEMASCNSVDDAEEVPELWMCQGHYDRYSE
ncbi:hypothetical protein CYMTET_11453 [Cymbomonas tetramitiformis]|uniref:Uncharacterized protein n=1 Tax=Cymbomonas tetramitiformis TaxID=36881 RepID=A0AAE0GMF7_9CHLO|nr:hypothetical protein CYMTET_11453 [Cymbomonas tetramitiformis]